LKSLDKLHDFQAEISLLDSINAVLGWDQNCMMPPMASSYRGRQMGFLAQKKHSILTSEEYEKALDGAFKEAESLDHDDVIRLNLNKSRRELDLIKKVPGQLVVELAEATVVSQTAWEHARLHDDYETFLAPFTKLLDLTRRKADCYGLRTPYDGMIADFEVDIDSQDLENVFDPLRRELIPYFQKIMQSGGMRYEPRALQARVPRDAQEKLGNELTASLGFATDDGLLYVSSHPFSTTLGPSDFRITTRYEKDLFISSFTSIAHEVGHSLYERGIPQSMRERCIGKIPSSALHESQSLFWEKRITSSRAFLANWVDKFRSCHPDLQGLNADELYASFNQVKPGLIRIEADEVTYPLHILVRYEIEKQLFNDNLDPRRIPALWNAKYEEYLGITPPSNSNGCLQDIHWACGLFGYFPSYALGHFVSAQFSEVMEKQLGSIEGMVEKNELGVIKSWLNNHFYQFGGGYGAQQLMQRISGKEVDSFAYMNYLKRKYKYLYALSE
jgi:carboxypeptidase Taq